jgi:hypothetical protein
MSKYVITYTDGTCEELELARAYTPEYEMEPYVSNREKLCDGIMEGKVEVIKGSRQ